MTQIQSITNKANSNRPRALLREWRKRVGGTAGLEVTSEGVARFHDCAAAQQLLREDIERIAANCPSMAISVTGSGKPPIAGGAD
jgi:hypothetical protein